MTLSMNAAILFIRRWSWRILRVAVFAYVGLGIVIYFLQTRLIYPGKSSQGQAAALVRPDKDEELVNLSTRGGERVSVLFGPATDALGKPRDDRRERPTLIIFYGNGENVAACVDLAHQFRHLGWNVLVPEYVGYGMSTGSPSEKGLYDTAQAAYDYLLTRKDIDPKRIVLFGRSLGGAAVMELASRQPVAGIITVSAFTSLPEMARKLFPILPTSLLLRDRFENERKVKTIACPYFNAHGTADPLVPFEMSNRLAAAAKGPVTKLALEGATHNDVLDVGGKSLLTQMQAFVEACAGGPTPH